MGQLDKTALAPASFAEMGRPWIDFETLSNLLAAAAASVDSDKTQARTCIERAEQLLGSWRSRAPRLFPGRPVTRGGLAPWRQTRVTSYVEANLDSQITATDLAQVAHLSTGHFFRAFRESFGEPPLAFVARQRIRRSQELMLTSRATLAQIAVDCGMFDQAHFSRVFRKIVGLNPSLWRREFSGRMQSL